MSADENDLKPRGFLRENWLYIVLPIALVVIGLVALFLFGGGSDASPFIYNIF